MVYDLEEHNAIDEVVENLIEMSDIKNVRVDDECVSIKMQTYSGQIVIKRFVATDKISIVVE